MCASSRSSGARSSAPAASALRRAVSTSSTSSLVTGGPAGDDAHPASAPAMSRVARHENLMEEPPSLPHSLPIHPFAQEVPARYNPRVHPFTKENLDENPLDGCRPRAVSRNGPGPSGRGARRPCESGGVVEGPLLGRSRDGRW